MLRRALLVGAAATVVAATFLVAGATSRGMIKPAHASFATGWPTYHFDNARSANDTGEPAMTTQQGAAILSAALDEKVQAEPLVLSGLVIAATENDTVYAFKESDMTTYWSTHLGTPVADSTPPLFCEGSHLGNSHVGITSTPVIDTSSQIIYAVGLVVDAAQASGMKYQLYSINLADGSPAHAPVDLVYADIDPRAAGQRSALILVNGYVYVAFGGRDGDCSPYHPVVVAYNISTGAQLHWNPQTGGQSRTGIWAPSGFAADGSGNLYVTTGNGAETNCSQPWDHGDGIVKFSPPLTESASWKPSDWCSLSAADADIGSIGPGLISGGYLFQAGKAGDGYVINTAGMTQAGTTTHIGGCQTSDATFGGTAYDGTHLYVPCDGLGMVALSINPATDPPFTVAWTSTCCPSPGPPIVAGGYVWATAQGGGTLYRYDPTTGAQITFPMGSAGRFNTPAADSGRIFVAQNSPSAIRQLNFSNVTPPSPPPPLSGIRSYFSWYDHASTGMYVDDIHVVNPSALGGANAQGYIRLPGQPDLPFNVLPQHDQLLNWPVGVIGGPVTVVVTSGPAVKASQRVTYGQSFNEVLAQPASAAASRSYFSWFDKQSVGMYQDNIHIVNPAGSGGTATGTVTLNGGNAQAFSIVPGAYAQVTFPAGLIGGPVVVNVTSGPNVLASQRVTYFQSFNEVLAQPGTAATTTAYFSWFDKQSAGMYQDNVHLFNPGGATTTGSISVHTSGGGTLSQAFSVPSGQEQLYSFGSGPGQIGGPVTVAVDAGKPAVIASLRVTYLQSFNEVAPLAGPLTTGYFTWFDKQSQGMYQDNLHLLCPPGGGTCSGQATVAGGSGQSFAIGAGLEGMVTFPSGTIGGPVVVTSAPGVYASQRVTYLASFNEVPAS